MDRLLPLAVEQHQLGNLDQADSICSQILENVPAFAEAAFMRAIIAHQRQDNAGALEFLQHAIRWQPNNPGYRNFAGVCCYHLGRLPEAVGHYREALQLSPQSADVYSNLSLALVDSGLLDDAEAHCRQALQLRSDHPEAMLNLGKILGLQGRSSEAISLFEQTLQINPRMIDARRNLGHAYQEAGNFSAAIEQYEHLLREAPRDAHGYYGLAKLTRFSSADTGLRQRIEPLVDDPNLSESDRSYLHFALGKIYDDSGEFDAAFGHFEAANRLMGRKFDRAGHAELFTRIKNFFTRDFFEQFPHRGSPSELPVFIVGMPRSATTLVEQIVASHRQSFGGGELSDIDEIVYRLPSFLGLPTPYPECVSALSAESLGQLADRYLARRRLTSGDALRVTDKMPWNFANLGLIALLFPGARVIHCRRDPFDVCLSCYFTRFTSQMPYAWDLGDLGVYYREYQALMEHWRQHLPLRMIDIDYEDLVENQEATSRLLVEFCGFPWDDRCLQFHNTSRTVRTASNWQVRQPIYRRSVGRWENYARHLGPLLEQLRGIVPELHRTGNNSSQTTLSEEWGWGSQIVTHHFGVDG
jgi:Flp pilus assembly protein TadD